MKLFYTLIALLIGQLSMAQEMDSFTNYHMNAARTLLESKDGNLLMGAYGEVHY